jgi:arginine/lysine/ornithine decarboxylase
MYICESLGGIQKYVSSRKLKKIIKGSGNMMKTLWIRKDIWNDIEKLYELMRKNDDDLTLNKALNHIMKEGLVKYADGTCSSS